MNPRFTHYGPRALVGLLVLFAASAPIVLAQEGPAVPGETPPQLPQQDPPGPGAGGPDTLQPGEEVPADPPTAQPTTWSVFTSWLVGVLLLVVALGILLWVLTRLGILRREGEPEPPRRRKRTD